MSKTITVTRTVSATALDNELGRRRNNKKRAAKGEDKVRAKAFYLPKLSTADVETIKGGGIVSVEFSSGRVEHIGLKVDA